MAFTGANILALLPNLILLLLEETNLMSIEAAIDNRIGQVVIFGFFVSTQVHLISTFNRFCAIHYPLNYAVYFSIRKTKMLILSSILLSLIMILPLSFDQFCYIQFKDHIWQYGAFESCQIVSFIIDFLYGIIMGVTIITIDTILLSGVIAKKYYIKKENKNISINNAKSRVELKIFIKTLISNIFMVFMQLSFHCISAKVGDNLNAKFIFTSLMFALYHSLDGIIVGLLHPEVFRHIKKKFLKQNVVSIVVSKISPNVNRSSNIH